MAISEDLPGVEVDIVVDGEALTEYRDTELEEDDRTTTRYIEAKSGQVFQIRLKARRGCKIYGDALSVVSKVDGGRMDGSVVYKSSCTGHGKTRTSEGAISDRGELRRYQFAALETVQDGHMLKGELKRTKDLGTIQIELEHVHVYGRLERTEPGGIQDSVVSEKALKGQALTHRVQLAAPVRVQKKTSIQTSVVSGAPSPAAVFVFEYRSIEALKAELIVPRTPTPPPLEERDIESLSMDELKELQRRAKTFREQQESKIKIKREVQEGEDGGKRRKIARPSAGAARLELDEKGGFRQSTTPVAGPAREIIEID